ncbi:homocysteine S-methyltransferase family protein [Caproiciproducens faecalis]|uniref:Methionine synthase n=1 Tax=Caproiciproducens faecalis TaxID=2820301 RepID=A0ABS7DNW2_9FIRM|nr:homocysteine S-methyltransferase family protein [Caproiciproducens faecalis]MBW7572994.1 homocysteine S-methyltransferase family protein [Caproiciproducens faecalis]
MEILEELGKRMVFFDGGMGTLLQENGLGPGELPELWNLTRPELIEDIHRRYRAAGADILTANTFGANPIKLHGHSTEEIVTAAVNLARKAAPSALIAMDIGPTGKLLKPLGDLDFEDAVSAFARAAAAGEKAGADLILIETMSDTYECKAAVLAAKESTRLPVFVTMVVDEQGKLLTGGDIPSAVALLEGLGVDAIGLNCGFGPEQMKKFLPQMIQACSLPVIVNPNAGLPRTEGDKTVFDVGPEEFAAVMEEIAKEGAWILGGCCGTTPEHIAAVVRRCKDLSPQPIVPKNRTVVSSFARAVVFGEKPVLIGERINPTGKSRLKQALRDNDMDYLLREAITQQENGAHILDVNVGLPEIDEPALLRRAVMEIQGISDLPLQLDTSDPKAMEDAMRIYNGKPLVNSVNGKAESMEAIFPLVKKYGGAVIALTLDENGIPSTAQGRFEIAEKIVKTAQKYGIEKKDLVFDTLAMTISAGQENAAVTLEALRLIRDRLGAHTSLGVSNISFGLPQREHINAAFFTMALQNGLGAAIVNPNSAAMMDAYHAYCALSGSDGQCAEYIARYSAQKTEAAPPPAAGEITLLDAVVRGLKESAHAAALKLVETQEPLDIINTQMIPALDRVGKDFEQGVLFLPQLLMSAEAAKSAFEVIRGKMTVNGEQTKKEKIILATVKGDIHDIGKNIVKVLLENYSYDVIDLGKDVPPETVVDAAESGNVKLVGLSALMTTTVANMAETIRRLHERVPDCRVMVGGAVLTPEYAKQIHADAYSRDAMGSVHYAQKLFSGE